MPVSTLPPGWSERPLDQIASIRRGITYTAEMLKSGEDGLPYVNMKSFLKGGGFNHLGTKNYSGRFSNDDLVGTHDLLIANTDVTAGDIVGVPALLPDELATTKVLFSHHVTRLRLSADLSVPFVFHLLCLPEYRSHMLGIARGTTVLMLDMRAIKQLPVRAPADMAEQRGIAAILDTLDEAIRRTEQVIEKLKQMKQGLLHDLLTRGIDDNGELRPPPDEAPHLYKDSPLGRIPRGWETGGLDRLATNLDGRRIPLKESDRAKRRGSFRYYGASGVIDWIDDYLFDGSYVLLGEDGENVISRRLPLAFKVSGQFWVNNHAHIFAPLPGIHIDFLTDLLEFTDYSSIVSGSAQPKLTQDGLRQLMFRIPPTDEQPRIAAVLEVHECRAMQEAEQSMKLRTLKHGLMDDLLTGRVRVSIPAEEQHA